MEKTTNTSAHKWLAKVIQEFGDASTLAKITGIPVNNFYYWRELKIKEGEDLIKKKQYVDILQIHSKFKTLAEKLMPSIKKIKLFEKKT